MALEDDDWDWRTEELDSLERDVLVGAVRKIPKSSWNAKERLWMFPISSLSSAEKFLHETSGVNVEVENVDPLVHRAIAAASVFGDILGYSCRRAAIRLFSIF
ncbi:PREDICTED: SWI/SNF-related matrix-associated actin-dependent regulator of chromatin subfamily A [Prunus dulcis]|uniref:PREDICTED: SWI/SNF-related matrix-associated actin-dependent regulator of chromatin subfamily A n=1 Tax=Prunus dulcis TaxID=3755 RepID=A0A5E4ER30_PRUDU|nr:PREDICTED: SWI/SNF-related matrix-associated actin-dependent regulator of chromatin subfamily A [Prunus dulcis]